MCGRKLTPHQLAAADDPSADCGGDCLACMRQIEADLPAPATAETA